MERRIFFRRPVPMFSVLGFLNQILSFSRRIERSCRIYSLSYPFYCEGMSFVG